MYTVKGIMILDSNGERLVSKYYPIDGRLRSKPEQLDFEKGIFSKTARNNGSFSLFGSRIAHCAFIEKDPPFSLTRIISCS
jgi:hypothetical protein